MTPEIKQRWVEALRSGKYQQGQKLLRSTDEKFCCLGVLCDIDGAVSWICRDSYHYHCRYKDGPSLHGVIDPAYEVDLGLHPKQVGHLIDMNDAGQTFEEIADWIEENL